MAHVWDRALSGLTDRQIADGTDACLMEHRSAFMPTPAQFRAWCLNGPQDAGRVQSNAPPKIEWWWARDSLGREIGWHDKLKDANGNPIQRDPTLEWTMLHPKS